MTNVTRSKQGNILDDEKLMRDDLKVVVAYTKDKLFPRVKFLYHKDDLEVTKVIFKHFKRECLGKVGDQRLTRENENLYLQALWRLAIKNRIISDQLNSRRSAVYTVMMNRMSGKCNHG